MPRLCIDLPDGTLVPGDGVTMIDVPVTTLEIEDGILSQRHRVAFIDALTGAVAHSQDPNARGVVLRIYLHPEEGTT